MALVPKVHSQNVLAPSGQTVDYFQILKNSTVEDHERKTTADVEERGVAAMRRY
jgi:hypothetical protein